MISDKIGIFRRKYFRNTLFSIWLTAFLMPHQLVAKLEQISEIEQENSSHEIGAHNNNEQSEIIVKERKKKKKRSRKKKHGQLLDDLNRHKNDAEVKHIKRLFTKLDELYSKVTIKVQKYGERDVLGPESVIDLFTFLSGTQDINEIIDILEGELKRKLTADELTEIKNLPDLSLTESIRTLYKRKSIDEFKAHALILGNARMTWEEILKLMDLGASKTSTRYLIQLKTGDKFGNPIKLFEEFNDLAKEITKAHGNENSIPDDLLLHPIPASVEASLNEFGPTAAETLSDARVISEIRRHFIFLTSIKLPISFRPGTVDFRPNALMSTGAPVNLIDSNGMVWALLRNLNAVFSNNHYYLSHNSSLTNSIMLAPFAATYWGSYNWTAGGIGWWLSYTDKYLGIGGTYTVNFASGSFWSNGAPTYLMIGGVVAGWRNYLSAGVSLMTMMSSTVGAGASIMGTVTRDHDVNYKGIYPQDGRFPEIRGKHKIEIDDRKGVSGQVAVAANFSNLHVPIMIAFRAGPEFTAHRVYRTHVDLENAQRMLTESEIPGVLFLLGKKIRETKLPTFDEPNKFQVGDEFVETKTGKLSGAFVAGLQSQIPIGAVRFGATLDLTAEFELALRRLPANKFEISIEPKRIYEIGIFSSILNVIGAGYIDSMSLFKKQSFIFDFNIPEAVIAYNDLIEHGRLPTAHEIEIHSEDRGPEYLLTEFRAQNEQLKSRGIALNYLEQVQVSSDKLHAGLNARIISGVVDIVNIADKRLRPTKDRLNLRFDGIDWEFMQAEAKSIASNGIIAVRRSTSGYRKSVGQGFSGRFNKDLFVTHRRIHSIDDSSVAFTANKWQFDSLMVHGQYEDNMVTGDQENQMASEINALFSTSIGHFDAKNSRQPRMINLERELSIVHLNQLTQDESKERIYNASQITGVSQQSMASLLSRMKGKHPDMQALMVKAFIETQPGLNGFAAIHQLLGAKPEDLHIRTESGYAAVVNTAKKFLATHADHFTPDNEPIAKLNPSKQRGIIKQWKNKRASKKFYDGVRFNLRQIDEQLRLLNDDKYLIDDQSPLIGIYGSERVHNLVTIGARQGKNEVKSSLSSTRKTIKELMDLKHQGYSDEERKAIYKMAGRKHLSFEALVDRLVLKYKNKPLSHKQPAHKLQKRFEKAVDLIEKINDRIQRLKNDHVMNTMDKEYVESSIKHLKVMRDDLFSILNFRGLQANVVLSIQEKVGKDLMERFKTVVLYNQIELDEEATIESVPSTEMNEQSLSFESLDDGQQRFESSSSSEDSDFFIELKKK